jgi:hypothetical protein
MSIKNFNTWYSSIKESEVNSAEPTVAEPTIATNQKSDIISDVDNIIHSLETLAGELTEELNTISITEDVVTDFVGKWITSIRASKAQKKVNTIKINSIDLEFAAENATGDKKKALKSKSDALKEQAKELQNLVNDRFSGKGNIVDRKLAKAKIEGQLEIIKRTSGMEDKPRKKKDLVARMQQLKNKLKEEESAIAKLEDDNKDEVAAAKKQLKKEEKDKQNSQTQQPTTESTTTPEIEASQKLLTKTKDALAKAQQIGDEKEVKKLKELINEIEAKESWQIYGTKLGSLIESEIKKSEYTNTLNESRHQNLSVKDRFSRLM